MTWCRRILMVIGSAVGFVACGLPGGGGDEAVQRVLLPDLVVGPSADFSSAEYTERYGPRHVFIRLDDGEVVAFLAKDPNNGCRLYLADDEIRAANDIASDVVFWDPCHGGTYDWQGLPLDSDDADGMWRHRAVIRDDDVVLLSPTDGEPAIWVQEEDR